MYTRTIPRRRMHAGRQARAARVIGARHRAAPSGIWRQAGGSIYQCMQGVCRDAKRTYAKKRKHRRPGRSRALSLCLAAS
jgi:hypothetical protein